MRFIPALLLALVSGASSQSIPWSKKIGNADRQTLVAMHVDRRNGDMVLFGEFYTYPREGGGTVKGFGISADFFLHRIDSSGRTLWLQQMGTAYNSDRAIDMTLDSAGNAFVLGEFSSLDAVYPGRFTSGSSDTITADKAGGANFLVKYRPDGTLAWVRQFAPGGSIRLVGVWTGNGKVIVSGYHKGKVAWTGGTDSLPGTGDRDRAFIAETSGDGAFRPLMAVDSAVVAAAVKEDGRGNLYLGKFYDFEYSEVEKRNASGRIEWTSPVNGLSIRDLLPDGEGGVFVCGDLGRQTTLALADGKDTTLTPDGQSNAFVLRLNADGKVRWVFAANNSYNHATTAILAKDGTINLLSSILGYTLKLTAEGKPVWELSVKSGYFTDFTFAVDEDAAGRLHFACSFERTVSMLGNTFTSDGGEDLLIYRLDPTPVNTSKWIPWRGRSFKPMAGYNLLGRKVDARLP